MQNKEDIKGILQFTLAVDMKQNTHVIEEGRRESNLKYIEKILLWKYSQHAIDQHVSAYNNADSHSKPLQ